VHRGSRLAARGEPKNPQDAQDDELEPDVGGEESRQKEVERKPKSSQSKVSSRPLALDSHRAHGNECQYAHRNPRGSKVPKVARSVEVATQTKNDEGKDENDAESHEPIYVQSSHGGWRHC
jgi:hypothetical protein